MQYHKGCLLIQGLYGSPLYLFSLVMDGHNSSPVRAGEDRMAKCGTLKHLFEAFNDALSTADCRHSIAHYTTGP